MMNAEVKSSRKSGKARLYQGQRQRLAQLEKDRLLKMTEVARLLTATLETSTLIQTILETIPQVIPAVDACVLMLYDTAKDILVPRAWVGFISENIERLWLKPGESMSGYAFLHNRPMMYAGDQSIRQGIDNMTPTNRMLQAELTPIRAKSVMCAPLDFKGQALGVITVNNFYDNDAFTEFDLELLQSLASQASISIENSRLYEKQRESLQELAELNQIIRQQHQQLEHALHIHHTLSGLALENRGLLAITQALSDILKQPVAVLDPLLNLLTQAYPKETEPASNVWWQQIEKLRSEFQRGLLPTKAIRETRETEISNENGIDHKIVPIQAGNDKLGFIFTASTGDNTRRDFDRVAIEQAATVIALELVKEQSIFEVERRLRGELLEEILTGNLDENTLSRASLLGYDSNCRYWIILADIDDFRGYIQKHQLEENSIASFKRQLLKFISQLVTLHHPKSIVTMRSDMVVIMLGVPRSLPQGQANERAMRVAQEVKNQLSHEFRQMSFSLVLSRPCPELAQFKARYHEALLALQLMGGAGSRNKVLDCSLLGSALLLLKLEDKAELFEFVNSVLGALIKYDEQHRSSLLATLITYSRCDCDHHKAATELHVHSNTLTYRLSRVEEITGRSLSRTDDWLDFQLALRLIQVHPELIGIENS
jgi:DNA-binding PucR family transcriptional regulator